MKMRRLTAYVAGSVTLATGLITYAALKRPNFYSATVYLSQSNACLMILCNLALVLAGTFMYGLQQLLFGPLRPLETEQLWERGWFAVMEWVFAMSTFRDEFGVWFLVMFLSLFTGKIWGWIAEGRVEQLEQQAPNDPRLFHGRLIASLTIYVLFAVQMFFYSFDIVLYEARPGMTIMFVFEFAILCICSVATCLRYAVWVQEHRVIQKQIGQAVEARKTEIRRVRQEAEERRRSSTAEVDDTALESLPSEEDIDENEIDAPGWEAKRSWLFALDIISDLLKLLAYLAFFTILTVFYGIPIYIIRDLYMTIRSFSKRVHDYMRFQAATRDMDNRYPNATAAELEADNTCIVCREEMRPFDAQDAPGAVPQWGQTMNQRQKPKKLPCGHILHFACLSSWLERQQACPICRRSVFATGQAPRTQTPPQNGQPPAPGAINQNQNNQPRPNRNEGRVFRLGPFRIQFGGRVGRPDDQEILNVIARLARDRARDRQNGRNPAQAIQAGGLAGQGQAAGAAPAVLNQLGVAPPSTGAGSVNNDIHPGIRSAAARMALNTIEDQVRREIATLNLQSQRAQVIRGLLNELDRARGIPQAPQRLRPTGPGSLFPQHNFSAVNTPSYFLPQGFAPGTHSTAIGRAGTSEDTTLPAGLTLPPGWSLVPLNPVQGESSSTSAAAPAAPIFSAFSQQLSAPTPTRNAGAATSPLPNPLASFLATNGTNGLPAGPSTSPPVNGSTDPPTDAFTNEAPEASTSSPQPETSSSIEASSTMPSQPLVPTQAWNFPQTSTPNGEASSSTEAASKGKAPAISPPESSIPETHVEPPTPIAEPSRSHQPTVEDDEEPQR